MHSREAWWCRQNHVVRYRRILVPIDFSPYSIVAVKVAADLARELGARLRLVTVLDVGDLRVVLKARLSGFETDADIHRALRRWIRDQFATLALPDDVPHTRSVRRGIADQEILLAIGSYKPQLVVMGSRGLSHRLPLGSRTAAVLRRSPAPVLIVTGETRLP